MNENKPVLGSDLAKLDAHVIQPEEYDDIPELTDAWFEQADLHEGGKLIRRGRPRSAAPKRHLNIRLSARVVDYFRATGPGWQGRIDSALAEWIDTRSAGR